MNFLKSGASWKQICPKTSIHFHTELFCYLIFIATVELFICMKSGNFNKNLIILMQKIAMIKNSQVFSQIWRIN